MIEKLKNYLLLKNWVIKGNNDKFIGLKPPIDLDFDDNFILYIPIANKFEKRFSNDVNDILLDLYGTSVEEITSNKKEFDITFLIDDSCYDNETKRTQSTFNQFFNYLGWSNDYVSQKRLKNSYLFKIGKGNNLIFDFLICNKFSDFNNEIYKYNQSIEHFKPKLSIFTYQNQWKISFNEFESEIIEITDIKNKYLVLSNLIDILKKDNIENNIYYTFSKFLITKNLDDNFSEIYNKINEVLKDINNANDKNDIFKKFIFEFSNFSSQNQLKSYSPKMLEFKENLVFKDHNNKSTLIALKNLYKRNFISFFDVCSLSNSDKNEIEDLCKLFNLEYKDVANE